MRRRELMQGGLAALGCRAASSPSPSPARVDRIRLLSYNVLADRVAVERRIPALLRTMQEAQPDVLALQEVAPWFMDWIATTPWLERFEPARIDGIPARPNGQLILARHPTSATLR